jgi:hypothetical protein
MYPPDSYEELMMAAMAGNGCTECLATTHTADYCHEGRDPECWLWFNGWATVDEWGKLAGYMDGGQEQAQECKALRGNETCIVHSHLDDADEAARGTMVEFPTYEEISE